VLAGLYDRLVRPVEGRLGPPGTPLVVVADGEVAGVPFAALRDARRGRYLVEDHPLRFAGSLRDAARPPRAGAAAPGTALLVADPAFDPAAYPALARLPGAAAEARAIAAAYPGARVLAGPAAGRDALERALPGAAVVHYAGHAVFDDARPERSALVLAGGGELTAARLAELDLGGVRLVVLSACQTLRARDGRAGGFSGFARALLQAGAGGVVGSLWRVDDDHTRALMVAFHRAWRAGGGDGPGALRAAQLRLLRSADPALRSPAAWAAFRYAGG
jgi:CHAT domain-containing protein